MTLLDIQPTPMWTDIIQAIGIAFGLPVTIWGIFQLFIKDRDKERKISALEQLAQAQNQVVNKLQDQVDQLAFQSGQFQYQSSLMLDQNKLFEKQIDLQTSIFLHEKGIEEQKLKIEKQKRMSEIRPYFYSSTSRSGPDGFILDLQNKGGEAKDIKLNPVKTDFVFIAPIPNSTNIGRGETLMIAGRPLPDKTYFTAYDVTFQANLEYIDIDGNKYQQMIQKLSNGKHTINEPIFMTN